MRLGEPPPVLHEDGGPGEAEEGGRGRPLVSGPRGGVGAGGGGGGGETQRAAVRSGNSKLISNLTLQQNL